MKKIILIICSAILVIGGILLWWTDSGAPKSPVGVSGTLPIAGSSNGQPGVQVGGSASDSGNMITVHDFIHDPATTPDSVNPGYYYLGYHSQQSATDTAATTTPPYIIEYIASTRAFNISLLSEPIGAARSQAEEYLLNALGISKADACRLDYMISTPYWVNSTFSGENLGFSFCSGATKLP
jgi:hypothetical protein